MPWIVKSYWVMMERAENWIVSVEKTDELLRFGCGYTQVMSSYDNFLWWIMLFKNKAKFFGMGTYVRVW